MRNSHQLLLDHWSDKIDLRGCFVENELFCGSFAYMPRLLENKRWEWSKHFHVATSEFVNVGRITINKIANWYFNLERDVAWLPAPNFWYCESQQLYRISCFLLRKWGVSAGLRYSVALCKIFGLFWNTKNSISTANSSVRSLYIIS